MNLNKAIIFLSTLFLIGCLGISNITLAAYTSNYSEPTTLIRYGSYGTGVKWVQDMLNHNGYKLTVDGDFGNNTLSAVKSFQSKYGLVVDGIVGQATRNTLKNNAYSSDSTSSSSSSTSNSSLMYTTSNLNLRKGASTSYSIILTIPKSSNVTIVSNNSNGWALVKYNSTYGFVSTKYLSKTKPTNISISNSTSNSTSSSNSTSQNVTNSGLPTFSRGATNLITIIKNCKNYYANNKFYYSTAAGVRSIPADKSAPQGTYGRYYTDCSNYVSWTLYEYALANGKTNMKNYFSYQRNSATFASIGANGGNDYLSVVSKKTSISNVNLANAKPGDILVSPGHVEFFNSYTINSNGTVNLKVYNCGSTNAIQSSGITTSATRNISEITYILRVK